ncbi:MAG: hypothetical protein ACYC96_05030 [Fimbriimonadaceae bacterium]
MIKVLARSISLAGLVAVAAFGNAQVTRKGDGYLFRLHVTRGEKLRFRVPFSVSGMGSKPLNFHFGMLLNVLKVSRAGKATIHCTVNTGGLALPGIDPKGGSFVVDRRGRVADGGSSPVGLCVAYPNNPIVVGGKFVAPVVSSIGGGSAVNTQATFKLVGFSGVGIHRVARFTFAIAGNRAPGGSMLIRVRDGAIEKYFTNFVATPAATGTPVKVAVTVIRT